jgi:hypothetical protein
MSGIFITHPPPWRMHYSIVYDAKGKVVDLSEIDTRDALVKAINELFRKHRGGYPSIS